MSSEHAPNDRALAARQKIRADAAAIGVDEAFISKLVDEFYSRVQKHEHLGPVFNGAVHDWPEHLAKLKQFWESVALNAGVYSGNPMRAHLKTKAIEPAHFGEWLHLFEQTLRDIAPTEAAVDYFMVRASRIGESLKTGLFFRP
ncbi:group III truncated hemoglobin [Asticcacaulis sp.]|uniref:group III truncated hemoglobin n=1 Tax=Asticcacaulis sp. TaxID=1872648 RepID=UPI002BF0F6FC|nr:group III truncated hemoglobin [Asticcacaulis sp.]HTM80298.1 group III truncated hemoglobin [Asticcacaulis sp.]